MSGQSINPQLNRDGIRNAYQGFGGITGSRTLSASSGATRRKSARSISIIGTRHSPRNTPHKSNAPRERPESSAPIAWPGQPLLVKFSATTLQSLCSAIGPKRPSTLSACDTARESIALKAGLATHDFNTAGGERKAKTPAATIKPSATNAANSVIRRAITAH